MVNDVSLLAELALHTARLPPEQPLPLRLCSAGATSVSSRAEERGLTLVEVAEEAIASAHRRA